MGNNEVPFHFGLLLVLLGRGGSVRLSISTPLYLIAGAIQNPVRESEPCPCLDMTPGSYIPYGKLLF